MRVKIIKIMQIILMLALIFISGCTGETQSQPATETTAPSSTVTVVPSATSTKRPTAKPSTTPTQAPTATPTATVEPADGTPEKYLQILNEIYEYYENIMPSAATNPFWADDFLSPDGRYLALQYILDNEELYTFSIYDIKENKQVDIPLDFQGFEGIDAIEMTRWSREDNWLFIKVYPKAGRYQDTALFVIQFIDERNFAEYIYPYPEDRFMKPLNFNHDGNKLLFLDGNSFHNQFFVMDNQANSIRKYILPDGIYPRDILFFNSTDYLVKYSIDREGEEKKTEIRIVNGDTGKSEVVYSANGYLSIVDYDPDRKLILIRTDDDQFIFLNTETWTETTFLEENASFGQRTKLIGNCIPDDFEGEDGLLRAGLYNLITGEIKVFEDSFYIGWYPLFDNHLIAVHDEEYTKWIEFLEVVCE